MRATLLFLALLLANSSYAQRPPTRYPLEGFDPNGCMAKGRMTNCGGAVMQAIFRDREAAIPVLISQITETKHAKQEIMDYWRDTRTGDIAFILLGSLFEDNDDHNFLPPGAPDWPLIMKGCEYSASDCWTIYVRKHGRASVQAKWRNAWLTYKKQISWDAQKGCFRTQHP